MGRPSSSGGQRPKWEVCLDEQGNFYFMNTTTGETTWELPVEDCDDDVENEEILRSFEENETHIDSVISISPFQIALGVVDAMMSLLDQVVALAVVKQKKKKFATPAAEKRYLKNQQSETKRLKRERMLMERQYLDLLIAAPTTHPTDAGSLYTHEDERKWRIDREVAQIRRRYKERKRRNQHQQQVFTRMLHDQVLKQFRTHLLKYFLKQIPFNAQVHQQRILLLSSPQQIAEMEKQRKERLEPEMLERLERDQQEKKDNQLRNVRKIFVLVDVAKKEKVNLLQILFVIFSEERVRKYALQVRGLAELINSPELQRFVVDFVSNESRDDGFVTLRDFEEFVRIIEEVVDHYTSVKVAISEAEDDITASIESANLTGSSASRARLEIISKKKIAQELAYIKMSHDELENKRKVELQETFSNISYESLLEPKEEWEKNHQHRYIQVAEGLPIFCCLCRRRKWELWRREIEQVESDYRESWPNLRSMKQKAEELRLIKKHNKKPQTPPNSIPKSMTTVTPAGETPVGLTHLAMTGKKTGETFLLNTTYEVHGFIVLNDDDQAVLEVVKALVIMTERIHSIPTTCHNPKLAKSSSVLKIKSKKKIKKGNETAVENEEVQQAMNFIDQEESERKLMYGEDVAMAMHLERGRRLIERPLLQSQDIAHNAYIKTLAHCVNPSNFLARLQFERCFSFEPPQNLVLLMVDGAERGANNSTPSRYYLLQVCPCRSEAEALFTMDQLKGLKDKIRSPFIAQIVSVSKHMYQFFAESGTLVECWPVLFSVTEYFSMGTWLTYYRKSIQDPSVQVVRLYADIEVMLIKTFRDVAAGLAAMHSLGALHLNFNLGNMFVDRYTEDGYAKIRIGGFLACKAAFTLQQLRTCDLVHSLNPAIAPPETLGARPELAQAVTGKADVWMFGCALYEALMIWQRYQLHKCMYPGQPESIQERHEPIVMYHKSISEVLQEIPLTTSASLRSLFRMVLQRNPSQRPSMNEIVDYLTFAESQIALK